MADARPEYHFHDDYSLTPAYVLGYAFHTLQQTDDKSRAHGPRGVVPLLTELLETVAALGLAASLAAAEPLRLERDSLSNSSNAARIGAPSAARILAVLGLVEDAVHSELRKRGADNHLDSPGSPSLRVLLGKIALAQCPPGLRAEVDEACRALDAHLYTASVFHFHRVWDQLPGPGTAVTDARGCFIADPREDPALQCSKLDAVTFLAAVRARLESSS